MKCKTCNGQMIEIDRERVMTQPDENASEGQIADHMAAVESGDFGNWGVTEITYKCKKCSNIIIVQID